MKENVFDSYSHWTDRTVAYPNNNEASYLALGIGEEVGELNSQTMPKEIIAECGDVCWYAARYARLILGVSFSSVCNHAIEQSASGFVLSNQIPSIVGTITGVEKKRLRDGDAWDAAKREEKHFNAFHALADLMQYVMQTAGSLGVPFPTVLALNRSKLEARLERNTIHGDGDNR